MPVMLETAPGLAMKKTAEIYAFSRDTRPRDLAQPGGEAGLVMLVGGKGQHFDVEFHFFRMQLNAVSHEKKELSDVRIRARNHITPFSRR